MPGSRAVDLVLGAPFLHLGVANNVGGGDERNGLEHLRRHDG